MHGDARPGPERHQHLHAAVIYDRAAPRAPHSLTCTAEALATGCIPRAEARRHRQAMFTLPHFVAGMSQQIVVLFLVYETACDCAHEDVRKMDETKTALRKRRRGLTRVVWLRRNTNTLTGHSRSGKAHLVHVSRRHTSRLVLRGRCLGTVNAVLWSVSVV